MTIDTLDKLIAAFSGTTQTLLFNKGSVSTQVIGGYSSLWRATGVPAQGAIPGAAAVIDDTLLGSFNLVNATSGKKLALAKGNSASTTTGQYVILFDRLAHMGGLSGTSVSPQTVGVDVSGSSKNLALRRGRADYSDVEWFLEWYTTTGGTGVNATVTYTNGADTPSQTVVIAIPASQAASRMLQIVGNNNEPIRSVQSLTLSATTGTAGSFGVTAARRIVEIQASTLASAMMNYTWQDLGLPAIEDDSCLFFGCLTPAATTGSVAGSFKIVEG